MSYLAEPFEEMRQILSCSISPSLSPAHTSISDRPAQRSSLTQRAGASSQADSSCAARKRQPAQLPDRLDESFDVAQAEGTSPMAVGSVQ